MKLSIFTTVTAPESRGDNYSSAFQCYGQLADEVVVVDGTHDFVPWSDPPFEYIYHEWPFEFSWEFIGEQFQRGYEAATGDWVIHADIDFLFHEKDFDTIRQAIERYNDEPALSFWKHQFILPDRYNLKSRLVVAVNKGRYGDRIRFDSGGDLCQPSLDGKEIKPEDVPEARLLLYNYEKLLKTERQIKEDVGRMARAWQQHFGEYRLGGPGYEHAYQEWLQMVLGRFKKPQEIISLDKHPIFVQEAIQNLTPEQWGYNGLGNLPTNVYVQA